MVYNYAMQDNIVLLVIATLIFLFLTVGMVLTLRSSGTQPSPWQALLAYWEKSDIRKREAQKLELQLRAETERQQTLIQRNVIVVPERVLERGRMDSAAVRDGDVTTLPLSTDVSPTAVA